MRKSDHFDPRQPPCGLCRGSGLNRAGDGTCSACRGFGNAPADPNSPAAPAGTICPACGNPARPGDPVIAAKGVSTHRSHARKQMERYTMALALAGMVRR